MARFSAVLVFGSCLAFSHAAQAQLKAQWMKANQQHGITVLQGHAGGRQSSGWAGWNHHGGSNNGAAAFWNALGNAVQSKKNQAGYGGRGQGPNYYWRGYPHQYQPRQYPPSSYPPSQTVPSTRRVAPSTPPTKPVQVTPDRNIKPLATDPRPNELNLVGRPLTQEQIDSARDYFQQRLAELSQAVARQLPLIEVDSAELMQLMIAQGLAAEIQVRILDAIRAGDVATAQQLWTTHCSGVEPPFRQSRFCMRFRSFCARLESGTCTPQDAQEMEREMLALGIAKHPCCGAPSLLEEIRECVLIGQRIGAAGPGIQSQTEIIPPGDIDLIYNPGLTEGDAIVLDAGSVMLGTGGIGAMHVQHGNVAQQQGLPIGAGISVPDALTPLVTSGILVENTTQTPVDFVLANQKFELAPLARQTFAVGPTEVSFYKDRQLMRFGVKPGTLQFIVERDGFGIQSIKAFKAVIDNSDNDSPFHYIVQGEYAVVEPRSKQSHQSPYPLVLRFDRGNGSATKQVISREQQATFTVGVNRSDNLWDLFVSSDLPAARPVAKPGESSTLPLFPTF